MACRFTRCRIAVVAGRAVADYAAMVEAGAGESARVVTCRAVFAGDDVRWYGHSGRVRSVMTGRAVLGDTVVIE